MFERIRFTLSEMIACGHTLRRLGDQEGSMEGVARRVVHALDAHLVGERTGERACVLVRFFRTQSYGTLSPEQQRIALERLGGAPHPSEFKCLNLLATVGVKPEWNDRRRSLGHQVIPLPSLEAIEQAPMIAQLVQQLGLEAIEVLRPDPALLLDMQQRSYNVFHVPKALGSPFVPAQETFVRPMGVRSVLGFGGVLPDGDLFAVILFSRCFIPRATARLFRPLALSVKVALLPWVGGPIFEDERLETVSAPPLRTRAVRLQSRATAYRKLVEVYEQAARDESRRLERARLEIQRHAGLIEESEQKLRDQTRILRSILDSMGDAVLVADQDAKFLVFNPAAERMFGIRATDSTPEQWSQRYGFYLPDRVTPFPPEELALIRAIRGEPVDSIEMYINYPNVSEGLWASITGRPVQDEAGRLIGGVIVCRDITERKRTETYQAIQYALTRILAEETSITAALPRILETICESLGWDFASIWKVDHKANELCCLKTWHHHSASVPKFEARTQEITFPPGVGLPGRVWASGQPAWIRDVTTDANFPRAPIAAEEHLHGAFGFPILLQGQFLGMIEFFSREIQQPDEKLLALTANIGAQIGQFIERKRVEEQLQKLWRAVEQSANLIIITDASGRIEYVNPHFTEVTGYTPDEALGRNPRMLKSGHTSPEEYRRLWETITAGKDWRGEFLNRKKTGDFYWASATISPIRNLQGGITHFVAVEEDITELKQVQEERDRFFTLSIDMLCIAGMDGYFKRLNPAWERILGYTTDELLDQPFLNFVHPDDHAVTLAEVKKLRSGADTVSFENRYRCRDGSYKWFVWNATPVPSEHLIYAVAHDITTRKRTEEALRVSEQRYRQLTEGTLDAIVVADHEGRITLFNAAAQNTFGYTEPEVLGQPLTILMPPEFHEAHRKGFRRYLETREPRVVGRTVELRGQRKNGEDFPLELSLTALDLPEGVVFLGAIRDMTDRARMQARVVQAEKLASLGMMSAGMAHEINNPLAYVANNLSVLQRDSKSLLDLLRIFDETRESLQTTHPDLAAQIKQLAEDVDLDYLRDNLLPILDSTRKGVKRIADIVQNLRGFARLDQASIDRVDLHEAISSSLEMVRGRFHRRNIEVDLQRGDLPTVICAPAQINQVILNLLVNAMQAIEATNRERGRIEIHTSTTDGNAVIEIADDGCGIPPEVVPKVFDPFFTTKVVGEGTGLGLSISHGIITDHGGQIEVESVLGQGTRFRILLPIEGKAQHDEPAPQTLSVGRGR